MKNEMQLVKLVTIKRKIQKLLCFMYSKIYFSAKTKMRDNLPLIFYF